MSEFETYSCEHCSDSFTAHPSANAADEQYCSPACEESGKGIA